jgi:hypothetical protein
MRMMLNWKLIYIYCFSKVLTETFLDYKKCLILEYLNLRHVSLLINKIVKSLITNGKTEFLKYQSSNNLIVKTNNLKWSWVIRKRNIQFSDLICKNFFHTRYEPHNISISLNKRTNVINKSLLPRSHTQSIKNRLKFYYNKSNSQLYQLNFVNYNF